MNNKVKSSLIVSVAITLFVAVSIAVTLMEQFADSITYLDLAILFILGTIAGFLLDRLIPSKKKTTHGV